MANALESELHYPLGDALPAPGRLAEVAPGVHWLRMPLPFALDHINLWLLRDRAEADAAEGWTLVDCGLDDPATRAVWDAVFATQLQGRPLQRVLCTHMHPDHLGLAHWITERFDCRLWISGNDWAAARMVVAQPTDAHGGDRAADFFARHGLTEPKALAAIRRRGNHFATLVPAVPPRFRRLMHGQRLHIGAHEWHGIAGYGHAPEHIALHCPALGVLIAGDMVLPRISTNVSVMEFEPEADPLTLYLRSIDALRALPADTLVLPSHGRPFVGLHRRIEQLQAHHAERFAQVLAACAGRPRSAAELLPVLFPRALDLHQTTFALGEAIAHVHALLGQGRLHRIEGEDGVLRHLAIAPAQAPAAAAAQPPALAKPV
jgi:glyoxylase-like metal-dependent hydrolase (beta-lactamase superfamily II)